MTQALHPPGQHPTVTRWCAEGQLTSFLISFSNFFNSVPSTKLFSVMRSLMCSMGSLARRMPEISSLVR